MERISDTVSSLFHVPIKDNRPVACLSADGTIIWSDIFGLGWRFGISYDQQEWFAKVRLYLDHNHSQSERDQAIVSVALRDTTNKDSKEDANGHKERVTTIAHFGHGQPALLGSWSLSDLSSHPYVSLTVTTKTSIPRPVTDPLAPMALALRQSMQTGDLVDTKFYVFSAKGPGTTAGKPRVVYVNSDCIGLVLPKSTRGAKQTTGLAPAFMVNMTSDHHITRDSVLHEYEYEQDSDLEDDDSDSGNIEPHGPGELRARSHPKPHTPTTPGSAKRDGMDGLPAEPPPYSVSHCRMILVKGVAYKTWASYVFFRYTGQVSFLPLKSAQGSATRRPDDPNQPPSCSPKSMYRLATRLGDERLKELAFRAIKEGLSKKNIVEEAFSWFTAQYPTISEYQVEKVSELRRAPEVSSALRVQLKVVTCGEKPWADDILIAIMDKLNPST